jgi:hypothetical protein
VSAFKKNIMLSKITGLFGTEKCKIKERNETHE